MDRGGDGRVAASVSKPMNDDLDHLLPSIAVGDADAFGQFVARAEPSVRRGLRSFAAFVDTEAVVQEAFLRVWQVAPRFVHDGRGNGLLRLTARIARNLALSESRKRRTEPLDEDDAMEPSVDVGGADPLLRKLILDCLEKLAGPTRAALGAGSIAEERSRTRCSRAAWVCAPIHFSRT